jgi:hypothetical protein
MAFTSSKPDMVVGIDFGMTSKSSVHRFRPRVSDGMAGTGVAYSIGPDWQRPETIQNWPGTARGGLADKVDTVLAYDIHTNQVVSWGFAVDADDSRFPIEELFKLYLDPDYHDGYRNAPKLEEARRWFTDYLSCIYREISRIFSSTIPRWNTMRVDFVFSVPTTWKNPAMIAETEQLIRSAGFGRESLHNVEITLTEAEAAAVYVSKNHYQKGDVFLVCDAGGGTTDVNILKMASASMGHTELEPLLWVEGRPIGSTLIDFKVEKILVDRLESIKYHLEAKPRTIAQKMMRGKFESFKCAYGNEAMNVPVLPLSIPGMRPNMNFPSARIENSRMIITQDELQRVFDEQIERIYKLVDEQLRALQKTHPTESVRYLVLSGGLGSSPYVQKKLRSRYKMNSGDFPNAQNIEILKAAKPQLAVVHGLVMDRVQQIKEGSIVYKERCCRNSYGIIVRQLYDPNIHKGEFVSQDPRDKKKWAEKQIHWFIRQVRTNHWCLPDPALMR